MLGRAICFGSCARLSSPFQKPLIVRMIHHLLPSFFLTFPSIIEIFSLSTFIFVLPCMVTPTVCKYTFSSSVNKMQIEGKMLLHKCAITPFLLPVFCISFFGRSNPATRELNRWDIEPYDIYATERNEKPHTKKTVLLHCMGYIRALHYIHLLRRHLHFPKM